MQLLFKGGAGTSAGASIAGQTIENWRSRGLGSRTGVDQQNFSSQDPRELQLREQTNFAPSMDSKLRIMGKENGVKLTN